MYTDDIWKSENIGIDLLLIYASNTWQNFLWPIEMTKRKKETQGLKLSEHILMRNETKVFLFF